MADTKQATPDECMRIGCGLPAAHLVHNRPSIGEYPIINYHDFVASRSGPDRTTQELQVAAPVSQPDGSAQTEMISITEASRRLFNQRATLDKLLPKIGAEAGPDRGQQDAPGMSTASTTTEQWLHQHAWLEEIFVAFSEGPVTRTRMQQLIAPLFDELAKAAREGQAQELAELKAKLQCMELRARSAEKIAGL